MTQHEDLRDHCGLATNEQAKARTSRIIIKYTSRTTILMILNANREIPAHSMCDDCWHGKPYDIEEIFPEDTSGPVRLPRRQAGSSPQGLAVTLLADYTLSSRAWLPSAGILALLAEAGVTPAGARTAISRLARRGVLEATARASAVPTG